MSLFSRIFRKEKMLAQIDLACLVTDFHSHLIPKIDDGSKSIEDSIAMIRRFKELGYKNLITTPHVMSDFYKNDADSILGGLEEVNAELNKQHIDIKLTAAAEYYLDEAFEAKINSKELLTFGDNYVLFELPFFAEPPNFAEIVFQLQTNGYKPILAHPERYGYWYNDFNKYIELKEKGVFLQLNILSLIGHYSPETKKIAEKMIDENLVTFLGSDCHNMHHLELMEIARQKPYVHRLVSSGKLLNATLI